VFHSGGSKPNCVAPIFNQRDSALDMQRYGVRSNAVAPFAWSRMIATLPENTPDEKARVARINR
jgi:hypothetical protein